MKALTFIFISIFSLVTVASAGITGKIVGTASDADTGEPLAGANIIVEGTERGAATDAEGDYYIVNLVPGSYTVRSSMIGYRDVIQTGVAVSSDHSTVVDFSLEATVIEGEEVTVVGQAEIIKMDISGSIVVANVADMINIPMVSDVSDYLSLQAGVLEGDVRGGGLDQTTFMIDGLTMVDNRSNVPMMMVNLSAVKELNLIKGGFNAEYGNVRSGLINVITQEGSTSEYHGSINFRMSPARIKHSGVSIYDPDSWLLRSYLDPGVAFVGTAAGNWSVDKQAQNIEFEGWNSLSARNLADADPLNDRTPQESQDWFIWRHAAKGAGALIPSGYSGPYREGSYGDKPDYDLDVGFGGPVPIIGKLLNTSFFASYRTNWEMFSLPSWEDYYKENTALLKLTSHLTPRIKLGLEGIMGKVNTLAATHYGGYNSYLSSGTDYYMEGPHMVFKDNPFTITRSTYGLTLDHMLSPNTFYQVRITTTDIKNLTEGTGATADTTTVRKFGTTAVRSEPYNNPAGIGAGREVTTDGQDITHLGGNRDWSEVSTLNAKFDITSQINKYNEVKAGVEYTSDDIREHYANIKPPIQGHWTQRYEEKPTRVGAYIQDKIEYEGIIANIGLRVDINSPNTDWYTLDRYSGYFSKVYKDVFTTVAPKEAAVGNTKISPRLGISFPISVSSKMYFNYGHFYSMPASSQMYGIDYGTMARGITFIGNPSSDLPRTVAYEIGFERSIAEKYMVHVAGYYKNVSSQTGDVTYVSFDGNVNYTTVENSNYADIRGFEAKLEKRYGRWVTGWINYDYMVTTAGYVGNLYYYEDPRVQLQYGLRNPYQERPLARPILRAYVKLATPDTWGPVAGGFSVSFLYKYRAGYWFTWDPLETFKLKDNLQWQPEASIDMRLSKNVNVGGSNFSVFLDIQNVLNTQYMSQLGFQDELIDKGDYLKSLHLPMYSGEEYSAAGYVGGSDVPGAARDKDYIDMPNRDFLTYLNLRYLTFGIRFSF